MTKKSPARAPKTGGSEAIYRLAVESAPTAMVLAGGDGKILLVNKQAERLFGHDRRELLGKPVECLIPERLRAKHVDYRRGYGTDPQTRAMGAGRDLFGLHKDGREIPIEIGLNPIQLDGEWMVLAAIVDISERRELQRRVAASEALAGIGAMAAVLAHEIRNPLGSIVMAAKSLARGDLEKDDRETVCAVLSEESQRLNRTLQDFLQYARPRDPRREAADLNHTVLEVAQALKSDRELSGNVRIDVSLDKALAPFPHDADQVRQVLWNLVLNGIQAMEGSGRLSIATRALAGKASLDVVDSGPGLKPESLSKIFDPFFTTKKKGTGLGLAIAQRIVVAHGGSLTAVNESGAGARFTLILPTSLPR